MGPSHVSVNTVQQASEETKGKIGRAEVTVGVWARPQFGV